MLFCIREGIGNQEYEYKTHTLLFKIQLIKISVRVGSKTVKLIFGVKLVPEIGT